MFASCSRGCGHSRGHGRTRTSLIIGVIGGVVLLLLLQLLLLVTIALTTTTGADARLIANITSVPSSEWTQLGRAPDTLPVRFTLALKQRNLDQLDRWFNEISDPTHENYRRFLEPWQVLDMIAPSNETIAELVSWLTSYGVDATSIQNHRDALHVNATVAVAQRLLDTELHLFEHTNGTHTGVTITSWGAASVPDSIAPHIQSVIGLTSFPTPLARFGVRIESIDPSDVLSDTTTTRSTDPSSPSAQSILQTSVYNVVTSLFFYNAYAVPDRRSSSSTSSTRRSSQAIIGFINEYFNTNDLANFGRLAGFSQTFSSSVVGYNDQTDPGYEGSMDIQAVLMVNPLSPSTYWSTGTSDWVVSWAIDYFNSGAVPLVVSISYGSDETVYSCDMSCYDGSGVTSRTYYTRANTELQKLALRGVTVVVSSGDDGANSGWNTACNYTQTYKFHPVFPASSPYVLSVGATEIDASSVAGSNDASVPFCSYSSSTLGASGFDVSFFSGNNVGLRCPLGFTERAVSIATSRFTSGGGFSVQYARPAYQNQSVQTYFSRAASSLPPSSYYNAAGRGFPDVAAYGGTRFIMLVGSKIVFQGGTSLSAPVWAGIISLLNEIALSVNGLPLGFVNPLLYAIAAYDASTFRDITVGDNRCPHGSSCPSQCLGFSTAVGWDPVTGLGTPNVTRLAAVVKQVLSNQVNLTVQGSIPVTNYVATSSSSVRATTASLSGGSTGTSGAAASTAAVGMGRFLLYSSSHLPTSISLWLVLCVVTIVLGHVVV